MDTHGPKEFANPMPTLPHDVVVCNGIPHLKWNFKPITLRNKKGVNVANAVCQNVDPNLVVDNDRKPFGDDRVAVQITKSLCEEEVLLG